MPIYNKLVRDLIPQIIKSNGKQPLTRILNEVEYIKELKNKSVEELREYVNAESDENALEELADLLEIMHALARCHGSTFDQLEKIRQKKAEKRGGFKERFFFN